MANSSAKKTEAGASPFPSDVTKAKQSKTKQSKAKQSKAKQNKTKQTKTKTKTKE